MLKKTIKYTDYNGVERNEDFYFNLSKAELLEMETGVTGGLSEFIKKVIATTDIPNMFKLFKELVLKAYGEKSADGKRFVKSNELTVAFSQTEAYSQLIMELSHNDDAAANFINGLIPSDMLAEANAKSAENQTLASAT